MRSRRPALSTLLVVAALLAAACSSSSDASSTTPHDASPAVVEAWVEEAVSGIQRNGIAPPSAARVLVYVNLAMYEALATSPEVPSLAPAIEGLPAGEEVEGGVHWPMVAAAAGATATRAMLVSSASAERVDALLAEQRQGFAEEVDAETLDRSEEVGTAVAEDLVAWSEGDGYAEAADATYEPSGAPGGWVRTPPAYAPPLEPGWGTLRTFLVHDGDCQLDEPVAYSSEVGSDFYDQADEVYQTGLSLTDEQIEIARFWNMEPSTGTPAGHWARIVNTVIGDLNLDLADAARTQALVSTAVSDVFVEGWGAKFETDVLRPITYIQEHIDPDWQSYLVTPQFPEFPSGHSIASAAAASMLTGLVGPHAFTDDSNRDGITRSFTSFEEAAREAADSRLYGGVHYPMGIHAGNDLGTCTGELAYERAEEAA